MFNRKFSFFLHTIQKYFQFNYDFQFCSYLNRIIKILISGFTFKNKVSNIAVTGTRL